MLNPFARSKNDLPSMNRRRITAWAHDIIDELQRMGILNPGNEKAADDLFRVYQNILQFYSWVSTRPRVHATHSPRPIQPPWTPNDIFASAHKVWTDLEWELRLEKDGAFIDQMIDHLGWFWNIKNNLVNQARYTRGLSVLPNMETMAEAANYARISSIDSANITQVSEERSIPLGSYFPRPMAPASSDNARNVEAFPAGYSTRRGNSGDNIMHPSRTHSSGTPSILQPKTGHLQLPRYSQSIQEQPHSAMPVTLSVKGKQSPSLHPGVQYQPPTARDKPSRNISNMAGGKYNDGIEYSQASQVPVGFILPAPQSRDDRYPNRAQGFGGGSKGPMTNIPALKPVFSGRNSHGQDLPTSHDGQSAQFHSGETRTKTGSRSSDTRISLSAPNNDVIVISDTPSPESTSTPVKSLKSRDSDRHRSSLVLSPEENYEVEHSSSEIIPSVHIRDTTRHFSFPVNPRKSINSPSNQRKVRATKANKTRSGSFDRRSAEQGLGSAGEKTRNRVTDTGSKKPNATENNLSTPKGKTSVSSNHNQRNTKVNDIGKAKETMSIPINVEQDDKANHFQKVNSKRPEPISEAYNTIPESHNKKPKISNNPTTSPSDYASPYTNFLKQYRPSNLKNPTSPGVIQKAAEDKVVKNKVVGGGHIGEKVGSEKSVGEKALEESKTGSKPIDHKSTNEIKVSAKPIIEKTASEDSAGDKLMAEAPIMEDAISVETSRNELASDKPASDMPLPAKNIKSKSLYRPFSMR
ncbi:uncharacterized protein EAE98_010159 [Botrytis deweyae]|uniref:Meiotically up-regulated protein Msb1/Mug8 domain-containing protein n=1 Tax=Botrytis deweyae TaxID=2478750 RepID=A0ABQ7I9C8_9HELO|nr:uncharacterized protein EAE98_010159 [Botrytis deweyae]KAF7917396.1 hypothetical protein EAE98_010159 [Botrytis deweyae]